jgi:GT2 family glycosyltransferase/predicted negative regulator of RcsB-dependent stress response
MRCSIVIPCWNGADLTRACLRSLQQQQGDHDFEILLVDNASQDDTPNLDQLDARIRVLRQPHNRGFAGGVNQGLAAARQPHVLVLNNDTRAAPNLLSELHHVLASDPRIGAVAPVSNHVKGDARLELGDLGRDDAARGELAAELARQPVAQQDVDSLSGLCLLLPRQVFAAVGTFDERFGAGNFEDDDLCLRLRLHGYRLVIARRAFLHHEGHATFRALGLDYGAELAQRRAQFTAKWRDDPAGRAVLAGMAGDPTAAAHWAGAARQRWPLWPDADWYLGRARLAAGEAAAALPHFAALLRHGPWHTAAALELGHALLGAGQAAAARAQIRWALGHCAVPAPHLVRLHRRLAEPAFAAGDFAAACTHLESALQFAPDDAELHEALGTCLLRAGNPRAAEAALTRAIAGGRSSALARRSLCHLEQDQLRAAVLDCGAALAAQPDDPTAQAAFHAVRARLTPHSPATAGSPTAGSPTAGRPAAGRPAATADAMPTAPGARARASATSSATICSSGRAGS